MKTSNGNSISKKAIASILRSQNSTEIYRLYHRIYGGKVERSKVYQFILEYSPSNRVYFAAYNIAYPVRTVSQDETKKSMQWKTDNQKHLAMEALRENLKDVTSAYAKRPTMGHTHLYFCSPVYGHADYNKWRSMEIAGNERFCETICRVADKYFI